MIGKKKSFNSTADGTIGENQKRFSSWRSTLEVLFGGRIYLLRDFGLRVKDSLEIYYVSE
jgi:hypothetical protein